MPFLANDWHAGLFKNIFRGEPSSNSEDRTRVATQVVYPAASYIVPGPAAGITATSPKARKPGIPRVVL